MIDPTKITNYNLTDEQLEEHILFWISAAGKNGVTAAKCLDNLLATLRKMGGDYRPFILVDRMSQSDLAYWMGECGMGCYNVKSKYFKDIASSGINLRTCTVDDLENIKGIGPKTARCFLIHSRPKQRLAGLDRHALHYLSDLGYKVPSHTPTRKQYKKIEQWFIQEADKQKKDIAVLDLEVWNKYRSKK